MGSISLFTAFMLGVVLVVAVLIMLESDDNDDDDEEQRGPCNLDGHEYEQEYDAKYYANGVVGGSWGDSFTVKKKVPKKCIHCGDYRETKSYIGRIHVDEDTDTLRVSQ